MLSYMLKFYTSAISQSNSFLVLNQVQPVQNDFTQYLMGIGTETLSLPSKGSFQTSVYVFLKKQHTVLQYSK